MGGGLGSRLGSAGLVAGAVVALLAGSSGVAAAKEDLGGCMYYAPGEKGGPTKCRGWLANRKNLFGRDFTGADLSAAQFAMPDLRGTNFTNANLSGVEVFSPQVSPQTQLRGAIVDGNTYLDGLVAGQEVTAKSGTGANRYFIVGGVNPGFSLRFRPRAVTQGVSIDECTSAQSVTVPTSINGQQVDVKALRPGGHTVRCTFSTADRPNEKGTTTFRVIVNDNRPAGPVDS